MNRGTVLTWAGLGLGVLATGGDQVGVAWGWLFVPGAVLFSVGVARWQPWRGQGWA